MNATQIKIRGHHCFKNRWSGLEEIKPVTVIIGRNNTGKSRLLDLVEALCTKKLHAHPWEIQFRVNFSAQVLGSRFQANTSGGPLRGNHWDAHGKHFAGKDATVEMKREAITSLIFDDPNVIGVGLSVPAPEPVVAARLNLLHDAARQAVFPLAGMSFRRLAAERNIRPEQAHSQLALGADGHGATNIIRRYLNTSKASLPRELIQIKLLEALNEVFGADGRFTEIEARQHDEPEGPDQPGEHWEIYLGEEKKGLIALSRSGSGLKTVLLVLLNLLVVPAFENTSSDKYVFAFEELETHLHSTLLRRLLLYIEKFVRTNRTNVFLTTHSSVALDVFGVSADAQIIHVKHDRESAMAVTVKAHFDRVGIVAELGARPSDLLNANGIIWVEGPSDRVYVNRWIELISEGELKEGRDYTCAAYGGALLAATQFTSPEAAEAELNNLLRINSNIVVICDSDRTGHKAELKDRVIRIRDEVNRIPGGVIWITDVKEIENYLPAEALKKSFQDTMRAPDQFERFFPGTGKNSFWEDQLQEKSYDKMDLAARVSPHLTRENLRDRFDWRENVEKIVETVRGWNR